MHEQIKHVVSGNDQVPFRIFFLRSRQQEAALASGLLDLSVHRLNIALHWKEIAESALLLSLRTIRDFTSASLDIGPL